MIDVASGVWFFHSTERLMRPAQLLLVLSVVANAVACAANPPSDGAPAAPAGDRTVITHQQMLDGHFQTAYDAVEALRGMWLRPKGPDSFTVPSQVWVYVDNVRLGDVESLRGIHPSTVLSLRYYNSNEATARWGVGHAAGVIQVTTLTGPP